MASTHSLSQPKTIEDVAADIARQHNANAPSMYDGVLIGTAATARGKNIEFSNVLKVKPGLSKDKINEFQASTRNEIFPEACRINANNPAFMKGLTYTYIYHSISGQKLAEFMINQQSCAKK